MTKYINDFDKWEQLDGFKYSNFDRFFAYPVKEPHSTSATGVVKVFGIKKNQYSSETNIPHKNYIPLFLVAEPSISRK